MLTSFFGKSSPVNFILLAVFIGFFWSWRFFTSGVISSSISTWGLYFFGLLLLLFSMLLLDFILRKNQLNSNNTYSVFLFSCLVSSLPIHQSLEYLMALLFVLLALRRIFSLPSPKNPEKKILDASLWILLASYFYFWSFVAFFLLYKAISNMTQRKMRYYAIPFVGFVGVVLVATAYFLITQHNLSWLYELPETISFQYETYANPSTILFFTVVLSVVVWSSIQRIVKVKTISKKNRPNYWLVLYALLIFLGLALIASNKTGGEWLFFFVPGSIIIAGFIEGNGENWFKEIILWSFLLLPLASVFL